MEFRDYLDILNRLDDVEEKIRKTEYPQDKEEFLEQIGAIRKRYELTIIESGEYPTF